MVIGGEAYVLDGSFCEEGRGDDYMSCGWFIGVYI
jgi:hypothetical protein